MGEIEMNEIAEAIYKHNYQSKEMNKQLYISRRTKNKRIKNKSFVSLFRAYKKEKPITIFKDVVLMDIKIFLELGERVNSMVTLQSTNV
jgi:hypothetical protein